MSEAVATCGKGSRHARLKSEAGKQVSSLRKARQNGKTIADRGPRSSNTARIALPIPPAICIEVKSELRIATVNERDAKFELGGFQKEGYAPRGSSGCYVAEAAAELLSVG